MVGFLLSGKFKLNIRMIPDAGHEREPRVRFPAPVRAGVLAGTLTALKLSLEAEI